MDKLQLGHIVKQEQKKEQQRKAQSPHNTTSSDYGKRKRELAQRFRN